MTPILNDLQDLSDLFSNMRPGAEIYSLYLYCCNSKTHKVAQSEDPLARSRVSAMSSMRRESSGHE